MWPCCLGHRDEKAASCGLSFTPDLEVVGEEVRELGGSCTTYLFTFDILGS
jgi:hypothetical protein